MSSRNDLFTAAWYVQYLDEKCREQLVTYVSCSDALKKHTMSTSSLCGLACCSPMAACRPLR